MAELEPAELKIVGIAGRRKAIQNLRVALARQHGVKLEQVKHAIDTVTDKRLGDNRGFKVVREKGREGLLLLQVKLDRSEEIVPHIYIGSAHHPLLSRQGKQRFVHFYIVAKTTAGKILRAKTGEKKKK